MDEKNKAGIEIPEDLTTADSKVLTGLKTQIAKKFDALKAKDTTSADELEQMVALRDAMLAIRAEESSRAEAQAQIDTQREAIAEDMADEQNEEEQVTTIAEATGATEAEGQAEAEGGEVIDLPTAEPVTVDALAAALVAALRGADTEPTQRAARAPIRTAARAQEARVSVPQPGANTVIVAAAGIDRVEMGSHLDRDTLSVALHEKARMLPDQQGNGGKGALVASIGPREAKNDIRSIKSDEEMRIAFNAAHTAPEQGLVASGGWCAPSETIYDFVCDYESMPEMVDLPTLTANRGGVRYPTSPLLSDVFADVNSGFTWTEADDIAAAAPGGPSKPCFTIPCPDFLEARLQAQGICVSAGNLTDRAYPELTNRYVDLVMTAHAHRMNGLRIARMSANSTAVSPVVADLSAAEAILGGIELQIACLRDQYFMSADFVLEVVLPRWVRTVIRRDLARRSGVSFDQVSNSDISTFFTEIGARVQFVSNWQTLTAPCTSLPASVEALVYPSGAHTLLDGGSLDLGVVRDSTLNATNDYTAAWTEEFWALITRCASLRVTIPLCADGSAGALKAIACPTA